MDRSRIEKEYSKYLEEFNKIGFFEENIIVIPNIIDKSSIEFLIKWIEDSKKDGLIERETIDNLNVINILNYIEKEMYKNITNFYTKQYGVDIDQNILARTQISIWPMGPGEGMPEHSDCEDFNGNPVIENGWYKFSIACICYINDNYDGGELVFSKFNKVIKPNAGDLVIFPSKYRHGVNPVSNGKRYSVPAWFRFNVEDNISDEEITLAPAYGILF